MTVQLPGSALELAAHIDQTNLSLGCSRGEMRAFVQAAVDHGFRAVCVLPNMVPTARTVAQGSRVRVATVVSFPLGSDTLAVKVAEARGLADMGAEEVDMVIDVGRARAGEYTAVRDEVAAVRDALPAGVVLKVIIEMPLLSREQSLDAALAAERGGADFIKTSTGFGGLRATVPADVRLLRSVLKPETGVKASGGIRTTGEALALIAAGANRLGASSGIAILAGFSAQLAEPSGPGVPLPAAGGDGPVVPRPPV